jgi:integrase
MRTGKLTALEVARAVKARKPGLLNDGGGLYLKNGSSWIFRYERAGKKRDHGLGPALDIGLADARGKAQDARRLLMDGVDPIEAKRASVAAVAKAITFQEAGAAYVKAQSPGWRSEKHRRQWESSLANMVYPVIGDTPVDAIGVVDVLRVLQPLWTTKPVTAGRVRNRIELILDSAKARGLRSGENPASWRGHLDKLLPPRAKVRAVVHFSAIDYREIAGFMTQLRQQSGPAPRALEFAILTSCRSGEVMGAEWSEIDLDAKVWTIPTERMKGAREHRVPLSDAALAVLSEMATIRMSDFVFPGQRGRLSHRMLQLALTRIRSDVTVHGFRSSFRDWAGNETHVPREICEAALGHATGNAVEAAYRRSDALEKRRELMTAWARHCERQGGNVVALRSA